ncbi:MAG: NAD kinase [Nitrosomonas sp.]
MNRTFETIALIGKIKNAEIIAPLLKLADFLTKRGNQVLVDELSATEKIARDYQTLSLNKIAQQADLAIVIGGDGTMLNIARMLVPYDVPLIGINQGRLGFLTDLSLDNMLEALEEILAGQYHTEERILLSAEVSRAGVSQFKNLAFNDVVLHRGVSSGMIEFEVRINGEYMNTLRSDGLIIATPTGSTAYALSAGGPILFPDLNLITLVPVCPHTLSNRPIVIGGEANIEINMRSSVNVGINCDSHAYFDLEQTDHIMIKRHPQAVRLLHSVTHSYYRMLREKLGWSEFP